MNKVMFMGVVARPILKFFFDGKIFLKRVSHEKTAKRRSENQKFVPDGGLTELIQDGDWHNHSEPEQTVGELFDSLGEFYSMDEDIACRLALTYMSKRKTKMIKITLDYDSANEMVLENRHIVLASGTRRPIQITDFKLMVLRKKGDVYQEDCSCDSKFMNEMIDEVGKAIRNAYWFLPYFISIYLIMDNAGGTGQRTVLRIMCR